MKYIFVSDSHIGSKFCQYDKLCDFLENVECEKIYFLGDIFDLWVANFDSLRSKYVRFFEILKKRYFQDKVEVSFVSGNHDTSSDIDLYFDSFSIYRSTVLELQGRIKNKIYVKLIHGHQFDYVIKHAPLFTRLGYYFQNILACIIGLSAYRLLGITLAKVIKGNKYLINTVQEEVRAKYIDSFDGVIFGHTHIPQFKIYDDFYLLNCGDWTADSTYIEFENNEFRLKNYENNALVSVFKIK